MRGCAESFGSAQYAQQEAARRDDMERAKRQMMLQIEQDKLAAKARLGEKYFDATTGADLRGQAAGREVNAANDTKNSGGLGYVKPANPWSAQVQTFDDKGARSEVISASDAKVDVDAAIEEIAAMPVSQTIKRQRYLAALRAAFPNAQTQISTTDGYTPEQLFPDK